MEPIDEASRVCPHCMTDPAAAVENRRLVYAQKRALEIVEADRDRLRAEHTALRAIIEGRTTPPTDAEIAAHAAAGGRWVVSHPRGLFGWLAKSEIDAIRTRAAADGWDGVAWLSVASDGRPCAWPTVMP